MPAPATTRSGGETTFGIAAANTGFGALMFALFPFLLPMLILTGVFLLPLAPLAIVAAAALGIRALAHRLG